MIIDDDREGFSPFRRWSSGLTCTTLAISRAECDPGRRVVDRSVALRANVRTELVREISGVSLSGMFAAAARAMLKES